MDIAGRASAVRQALIANVIDEITLDIAPVLLGWGERIFHELESFGFEPAEANSCRAVDRHPPRPPPPEPLGRRRPSRRRDTGQWAIPMGKQEMGETPSQCAIRETLEETGVLTEITGLLGVYSDPGHIVAYSDGEVRREYEVILTGRPVSGEPTVNDEASDVAWFAPGDLGNLDIHPTQWRQLRDWLDGTGPHID